MASGDREINPITGDYIRTTNGQWSEVVDSRTTVLLMIALEHGASPFDPADGTTIGEKIRDGDPVTPEDVRAETLRVLETLQAAGLISEVEVDVRDNAGNVLRDSGGRLLVRTAYRDLASGSTVELVTGAG